jgi:MFS family permease
MPSTLKSHIQDQVISDFTTDTDIYYNYFYTVYSWTNMLMSLCAGLMVDRLGKEKSMYIFVTCCLVGSVIYATGTFLTNLDGQSRYIIMFVGRFIFGLGGGPITIVQNAFTAFYFSGHEIAMAFGITLTFSRFGSTINYYITPSVYDAIEKSTPDYALGITLALGSALVVISLFAAVSLAKLDNYAQAQKGENEQAKFRDCCKRPTKSIPLTQPCSPRYSLLLLAAASAGPYEEKKDSSGKVAPRKKMSISDVKDFPAMYWILAITISIFYSIIFPFMADATSYLGTYTEKFGQDCSVDPDPCTYVTPFGLNDTSATFRAGLVYQCSMIISPFLGKFVDWFGRRTHIAFFGTALTIPVFLLLDRTTIDPILAMLLLGISYSVCAAALWPSVQLLVPLRSVGTANGVATAVQMLGIGLANIAVGILGDQYSLHDSLTFFLSLGVASSVMVLTMFFLDRDGKMYKGKRDADGTGDGMDIKDPLLPKERESLV